MEVGFDGSGPTYDRIFVDGVLDLGGTIRVSLTGSYRPMVGDILDFLVADLIRRSFDGVQFVGDDGVTWTSHVVTLDDRRQAWRLAVGSVLPVDEPPLLALVVLALSTSAWGGRRIVRVRARVDGKPCRLRLPAQLNRDVAEVGG